MKIKNDGKQSNQQKSIFNILLPILIVLVMLLAVFVKPTDINSRKIYSVDEVLYNMMANQIVVNLADYNTLNYYKLSKQHRPNQRLPDYFKKPLFKHPPMYCLLLTVPKRFNFKTIQDINYFSFYVSILLSLIVFLVAKRLYDNRTAFLAFLFMTLNPIYWICSLRIWMECLLAIFMYLCILFFIWGWKKENYYILCGILLGCAMLTKYPGVLCAPIILIFAVFFKPELFKKIKFYMIFLIAFLLFLPWIIWNINVYGNFLTGIGLHADLPFMKRCFFLIKRPVILLLPILILWLIAYKGYFLKLGKIIPNKKTMGLLIIGVFLVFLFSLKGIRQDLGEALLLNKLPPTSNLFPSIFAKEPWFFYIGQLLKMSPFFILAYLSFFFINSESDGDKLLLIAAFIILLFYIKWGNYQSRYILSAIPALMILASRTFFWLWDISAQIKNVFFEKSVKGTLIALMVYFFLKTIIVDMGVASVLLGKGYFTYF